MPPDDLIRLRRMLEAAQMALSFSQGRSRADLDTHPMYFYAVVKAVELVGEAATKVTTAVQFQMRDIQWRKITAMRNILVHDFHGIENDVLCEVIQDDMPILINQPQAALAQHGG